MTGRALLSLAAVALCCAPAPAQEALRSYEIVGDAIPKSLTGEPGDPERGRDIVVKRESTCLLCHSGPFPEQRFQGDLSPNLKGTGARSCVSRSAARPHMRMRRCALMRSSATPFRSR